MGLDKYLGWNRKYVVFKRCKDCGGTGYVRSSDVAEIPGGLPVTCFQCNGHGYHPPDSDHVYFVLSLDQEPAARVAAMVYAKAIEPVNSQLARDLRAKVVEWEGMDVPRTTRRGEEPAEPPTMDANDAGGA